MTRTRRIWRVIGIAACVAVAIAALALAGYPERTLLFWTAPTARFDPAAAPPAPDYDALGAWWLRPDSVDDRPADLFFVHGTGLPGDRRWNDRIAPRGWREGTIVLPAMTAPFESCCRIFAPKYRQANLAVFLAPDDDANRALTLAYADVRDAFRWYLDHANDGRPVILAGLSQGSLHLQRLLGEFSADPRLRDRLVVAYLIGYAVPDGTTGPFPPCAEALATGCVVSWTTVAEGGAVARWRQKVTIWTGTRYETIAGRPAVCVNPLTWRPGPGLAPRSLHKGGALSPVSNKVHPHLVAARCADGVLAVTQPAHPAYSMLTLPGRDYHVMEYNLFHQDIAANAADRVAQFPKPSSSNP
jgi:hypothetical protein